MPFSWIYGSITAIRNSLYDSGISSSVKPVQFTISIGNLTVGGTGKTPVTEYLTRLLCRITKTAILSRGYGRKTRGFVLAGPTSTAKDIGDEPLQYFTKFKSNVVVAVCENRVNGADLLHLNYPEHNKLLLDDAFQHRAIRRDINILLNDYGRPFYKDHPFPAGRLREFRSGAKRADAIIVTKCPDSLTDRERENIRVSILQYCRPDSPVFFSAIQYSAPLDYTDSPVLLKNVIILTGIANPLPFTQHIRALYHVIEEIIFPDHHNYTAEDLAGLIKNLKSDTFVLTTEKDMVKLRPLAASVHLSNQFAYLPITIDFGSDALHFDQWILNKVAGAE